MNAYMMRDLRASRAVVDTLRVKGDVTIDGDLFVKGSTTTLEVNNLEEIEKLRERMIKLEKRNELLEKIIIKLQFHPSSPYVEEVAVEWNELYKNGEIETEF